MLKWKPEEPLSSLRPSSRISVTCEQRGSENPVMSPKCNSELSTMSESEQSAKAFDSSKYQLFAKHNPFTGVLTPINNRLVELQECLQREAKPLRLIKRQVESQEEFERLCAHISKLIQGFAALIYTTRQIESEDGDAVRLLGMSRVIETWMHGIYKGLTETEIIYTEAEHIFETTVQESRTRLFSFQ